MKLILVWKKDDNIKQFNKEFSEVLNQYEIKDALGFEYRDEKIKEKYQILLEDTAIKFLDVLIEGKLFSKNEIRELIEAIFWIKEQSSCSTGCNTCASGC